MILTGHFQLSTSNSTIFYDTNTHMPSTPSNFHLMSMLTKNCTVSSGRGHDRDTYAQIK